MAGFQLSHAGEHRGARVIDSVSVAIPIHGALGATPAGPDICEALRHPGESLLGPPGQDEISPRTPAGTPAVVTRHPTHVAVLRDRRQVAYGAACKHGWLGATVRHVQADRHEAVAPQRESLLRVLLVAAALLQEERRPRWEACRGGQASGRRCGLREAPVTLEVLDETGLERSATVCTRHGTPLGADRRAVQPQSGESAGLARSEPRIRVERPCLAVEPQGTSEAASSGEGLWLIDLVGDAQLGVGLARPPGRGAGKAPLEPLERGEHTAQVRQRGPPHFRIRAREPGERALRLELAQ